MMENAWVVGISHREGAPETLFVVAADGDLPRSAEAAALKACRERFKDHHVPIVVSTARQVIVVGA